MAKEFKAFNIKYKHLIRTDAAEDATMRMAAELMANKGKWPHEVKQWNHDQVRFAVYMAPSADEWQQFRVSLKGQSTAMKLARLDLRYLAAEHAPNQGDWELEKIRIDNYIGALQRGGQLNAALEIIR